MAQVLDDFGKLALAKYVDSVNQYNVEVEKAKSVSSIEDFRETWIETDPQFAEVNEKIEKLESMLETLKGQRTVAAEPLLTEAYKAAVESAGVNITAMDELKKLIDSTRKYIVNVYGPETLEDTPKVEGRKGSGGTSATGGRRIRGFDVYVNGELAGAKNSKGEFKSTFTAAAKVLGVDTTDLQRAFFAEANNDDIKDSNFPTVVEFTFGEGEKAAVVRAVKVDDSEDDESINEDAK
jgi:hypothetical protein